MLKFALIAAAAVAMAGPASAAVFTDDFDGSNAGGFTSQYAFRAYTPGNNTDADQYTVGASAFPWNANFADYGDNTTGSGNYMIANGAGTPQTVWENSAGIQLEEGGRYTFGFALSDACCNSGFNGGVDPAPPSLSVLFRPAGGTSTALATGLGLTPGTTAGVWQTLGTGEFTVASSGLYFFSIVNNQTAFNGNDFGLDDINVAAVPEVGTWAMMIIGFGAVGSAMRRRKATTLAHA